MGDLLDFLLWISGVLRRDPAAVPAHLKDVEEDVLLVAPDAKLERLGVYQA